MPSIVWDLWPQSSSDSPACGRPFHRIRYGIAVLGLFPVAVASHFLIEKPSWRCACAIQADPGNATPGRTCGLIDQSALARRIE
jgi:hypothetical protein